MKKLFFAFIFILSLGIQAQDWSSVYRQIEEVTLNEGLDNEYVDLKVFGEPLKKNTSKKANKLLGSYGKFYQQKKIRVGQIT